VTIWNRNNPHETPAWIYASRFFKHIVGSPVNELGAISIRTYASIVSFRFELGDIVRARLNGSSTRDTINAGPTDVIPPVTLEYLPQAFAVELGSPDVLFEVRLDGDVVD